MKLNLGCGANKLVGYINIDIDNSLEPDQVIDFRVGLPFENGSVEKIVMYHVIEHIEKRYREDMLKEFHRVLQPNGTLVISYPEFTKIVENWKTNKRGMRDFWEATIYGRQASRSDYHVTIMDSDQFKIELVRHGFAVQLICPEPTQDFNTVIKAIKKEMVSFESTLLEDVFKEQR